MKAFFAAWQFLTVFPVPASISTQINNGEDLKYSSRWFPMIGLVLGLFAAFLDKALLHILPQALTSTVLVILLIALSGGLHADGLADTADGFLSSRPRERILEIMRDSRSGPMGVLALISLFSIKVAALFSLQGDIRTVALILAPAFGRLSMLYLMNRLPYARKNGGLASIFILKFSKNAFAINAALLGTLTLSLLGTPGLFWIASALLGTEFFARLCRRKIQGFTGDTLGASCEGIEALVWIVAAAAGKAHL